MQELLWCFSDGLTAQNDYGSGGRFTGQRGEDANVRYRALIRPSFLDAIESGGLSGGERL